mgnify:CR=1 FL=1
MSNRLTGELRDADFMRQALDAARLSAQGGEVPVGAVIVRRCDAGLATERLETLACTHNQPITRHDPSAHAEILALRAAAARLGNYRLDDCELYVTLEPCAMCAQAMLHARIRRVVYGAREPKTGAAGSVLDLFALKQLNHQTEVRGGVLEEECGALMREFFGRRRQQAKQSAVPLREDALRVPQRQFDAVWEHFPGLRSRSSYWQDLAELEGLRLHALALGPRDTGTAWLGLHDPDAWWPQLAEWAQGRADAGERVLLPDLIGFGQSDKPKKPAWHTLERHAGYLLAWAASLGATMLYVTYAKRQQKLAEVIQAQSAGSSIKVELMSLENVAALGPEWRDLPYPDAGHRAAPRIWHEAGWDGGCGQLAIKQATRLGGRGQRG